MGFEKKDDKKKSDEKKIKKASLLQVVQHLNDAEEGVAEGKDKETALPPALELEQKDTAIAKRGKSNKGSLIKESQTKPKKNMNSGAEEGDKSNASRDTKKSTKVGDKDKKATESRKSKSTVINEELNDLEITEEKEETYSKKAIRQEQTQKRKEKRNDKRSKADTSEGGEHEKAKPSKNKHQVEEVKAKRERRAAAFEPANTDKKLTRKERREMKIKNKGAGVSSKEFVRLLKEGEDKDLKDVPFESKGIMQFPMRSKAESVARKPRKLARGQATPRGRTRMAPKDKKDKKK